MLNTRWKCYLHMWCGEWCFLFVRNRDENGMFKAVQFCLDRREFHFKNIPFYMYINKKVRSSNHNQKKFNRILDCH